MWPKNETIITPNNKQIPAFLLDALCVSGIKSAAERYINVPAVNAKKSAIKCDIWLANKRPASVPTGVNTATVKE